MVTRINKLMIICGVAGLILAVNVTTQAQDFTWTYKSPMLHARGAGAAAVVGDVIYNIGGHMGGRYNEAYNILTNTWSSKAILPHTNGRYGLAAIGVNGKVYTFGGTNIGGNYNNQNIDEYDPVTNTWIPYKATYPISIARMAVAECDGKIYIFGGWLYQAQNEWVDNVYEYDPLTNIITQKASMPTARADSYAGTGGGKIYVVGGLGVSGDLDVVEMYDPVADEWATGYAPMPAPARVVGAVINNKIYVHPYSTTTVYEYNPSANSWTEKNPMQTARGEECVGAVENRLYIMGGFIPGAITSLVEEGVLNYAPVAVCQDVTVGAGSWCDADASIDNGSYDPDGDAITITQTPAGPYPLGETEATLTVTDDSGASDTCTAIVTVIDATPPVISLNGDATITLECRIDSYTEAGASVTDNCDSEVTLVIGGDTVDTSTCRTYIVTYNATDAAGNAATEVTRTVIVQDTTPPDITIVAPEPYELYAAGNLILDFSAYDLVSDTIVPPALSATLTDAGGFPGSVVPGDEPGAGVYTLDVTAVDEAKNEAHESVFFVVYDPTGGFVTGGGWIWSSQGPYQYMAVEGKANFGFVSKYKKGATVPTGQTEFVFQAGDLNFHSSSYEWLVVTGSNYARFKGWGTINGQGDYRFMLWAGDAPDTFRIRIWEEDEANGDEFDVYDNGFDQAIGGGSIVIHTN